ncbi:uncharacterized protein L199_005171 [Kwoniella botswanensis]|uniref:uncharacterized protein n=1 Tax=Kwoniella botswanensis TaxID=1268659 RepID=UPI00315DC66E
MSGPDTMSTNEGLPNLRSKGDASIELTTNDDRMTLVFREVASSEPTENSPRSLVLKDQYDHPLCAFHIGTAPTLSPRLEEATSAGSGTVHEGFHLSEEKGASILTCDRCDNKLSILDLNVNPELNKISQLLTGMNSKISSSSVHISRLNIDIKSLQREIGELKSQNSELLAEKKSKQSQSQSDQQVSVIRFRDDDDGLGWEDPCLHCSQLLCYNAFVEHDPKALAVCSISGAVVFGAAAFAIGAGISSAADA